MAKGTHLYGTMGYWLWYIVPFMAFIVIIVVYRKQVVENANIAKARTKKAGKVATRRLKVAKQKMHASDKAGFYDEVLKALWGYLGDKLSMPVSELSKDNIAAKLTERQVSEVLVAECLALVGECEFARYAPSLSHVSEEDIYSRTAELMNKLENAIK